MTTKSRTQVRKKEARIRSHATSSGQNLKVSLGERNGKKLGKVGEEQCEKGERFEGI